MRRNTATRRLLRALETFERSAYHLDHAGMLSELSEELCLVADKIDQAIENRLMGPLNQETAEELGE